MAATKLEDLPEELLLMILKYLSLYDRVHSLLGLNCRFDALIEIYGINIEQDMEQNIENWSDDDNLKGGKYIIWPELHESSNQFEWTLGRSSRASYLHPAVACICKNYNFDLNQYFFQTPHEKRLQKAAQKAETLYERSRGEPNEDEFWDHYNEKNSKWDAYKEEKEREFARQKAAILGAAKNLWNELLEENVLPLCLIKKKNHSVPVCTEKAVIDPAFNEKRESIDYIFADVLE